MPPKLFDVTWKQVRYSGDIVYRGYYAALIFRGDHFEPGVTWGTPRPHNGGPGEETPHGWQSSGRPQIQTDQYFEVSTTADPEESPLSWRGVEFAVRNPSGETSNWVMFSHKYDNRQLQKTLDENAAAGRRLIEQRDYKAAVEPLRKAMVYADRMFGCSDSSTIALRNEWSETLDNASLAAMRFEPGARVIVVRGRYDGLNGQITNRLLRHAFPYVVKFDDGQEAQLSDGDVEAEH